MHAGHVPVEGILLNRAVVAQWTAMGFLSRLAHHVDLQFALASEEFLTIWALQPGVWEVEVKVFYQVCPLLEATLAFWTHVGLEQIFGFLGDISCTRQVAVHYRKMKSGKLLRVLSHYQEQSAF